MKKLSIIFVSFLLLFSLGAVGQEEEQPLSIAIVGTTSYNDANLIIKNLKRCPQINRLSVSLSSRELTELSGSFHGSTDTLIEEIQGLAQDRFSVETPKKTKKSGAPFVITLRKMAAQ